MAMSRDRIRFFLSPRYYQGRANNCNNMNREDMITVFERAFNVPSCETRNMLKKNPEGFQIVCRPSQFARFIYYRNDLGGVNGIKDLNIELYTPEPKMTREQRIAQSVMNELPISDYRPLEIVDFDDTINIVKTVLRAENVIDNCAIEEPTSRFTEFDFSKNPACYYDD